MKSVDRLREACTTHRHTSCTDVPYAICDAFGLGHRPYDLGSVLLPVCDAIETEVAERYVELPLDADGKTIRFGDTLDQFGTPMTVYAMTDPSPDEGDCMIKLISGASGTSGGWVRARKVRHYHKPPTVEDVLERALNEAAMLDRDEGYRPSAADVTNIVNEYAAKLRVADGGGE